MSTYPQKKVECHKRSKGDFKHSTCTKPKGICYTSNGIYPDESDLQIIIPAYNVEKYLDQCLESVLNQKTRYSYNIVVIDDGSTDQTCKIADFYASDSRIKVIHQKNRGFSGARNKALENITGKYVMFVDSDDVLLPDAIQNLMDTAYSINADIVESGFYTFRNQEIIEKRFRKHRKIRRWGFIFRICMGKSLQSRCAEKFYVSGRILV